MNVVFPAAANLVARRCWLWRHGRSFGRRTPTPSARILVDVSAIIRHDAQTGIQRVVRSVWSELSRRSDKEYALVPVFASHAHGYSYAPENFLTCPPIKDPAPVEMGAGDRFLGLDLTAHLLPKYRQQLRAWRAAGATIHIMVYDLLPLLRREWFNPRVNKHFRNWLRVLSADVDQAICISRQVARDLRSLLPDNGTPSSLSITHMMLGGDISNSVPSTGRSQTVSRLLDRLRFRPAVLMVGTIEPRKAYDVALRGFEKLWEEGGGDTPDLVIVGKAGWKTSALQQRLRSHPEHDKRLHWLEGVSDEDLGRLYEACRGLLMTSYGEGFGLPLAEALVHQRYVLARDLSVFREQDLPNVLFFQDDRPETIAAKVIELTAIGPFKAAPTNAPTWSNSVDELLNQLLTRPVDTRAAAPDHAAVGA